MSTATPLQPFESQRDQRWAVNPASDLHWRQWGESCIVFNAASGQTHFINEIAAALLRLLMTEQAIHSRSLNHSELHDRLGETLNLELDDEFRDYVDELLNSLDELGLIVCQRPTPA